MLRKALFIILIGCSTSAAWAETLYVVDILRVGVRAEAVGQGAPIQVVSTGAVLEVLERSGDFIKVRTVEGNDGWISQAYLDKRPPARMRIKGVESRLKKARDDLKKVQGGSEPLKEENEKLVAQVEELSEQNKEMNKALGDVYAKKQQDTYIMYGWAGTTVVLFLFGMLLGKMRYRKRVAQRFGGLEP